MDDDNIKAAVALKHFVPKTVSDIRHILGLIGYHRRHIQNFSSRAKPLCDLLTQTRDTAGGKGRKEVEVTWTEECRLALDGLIDDITSPPILAYPDFSKEFILHTDASGVPQFLLSGVDTAAGYGCHWRTSWTLLQPVRQY